LKKKLLTLIIGSTVVMGLAACGGGSSSKSTDTASGTDPQKIVSQKCSSCHGDQLQGVVGPNLQKIGAKYSKAEILDIIKNGKGGGKMPAGLISGDDADKVATWLAAKK
jgi:cytochrome c551